MLMFLKFNIVLMEVGVIQNYLNCLVTLNLSVKQITRLRELKGNPKTKIILFLSRKQQYEIMICK